MNNIEILEELIQRCKECKFATCEQCEINNTQVRALENLIKENKELEKYDYRKIELDEKNKISSIHFTKEQLDLMNLGIALYVGIPKILADKEDEETDI